MADLMVYAEMLPEHMRKAVCDWIERAEPHPSLLGSFMRSILTNDLMGAFAHADYNNRVSMFEWVTFLRNYAPTQCHGSWERLEHWYTAHHPEQGVTRG